MEREAPTKQKSSCACPNCGNDNLATIISVEYAYNHPAHYDGISEYDCLKCQTRWGRWSGRILKGDDYEYIFGKEPKKGRKYGK